MDNEIRQTRVLLRCRFEYKNGRTWVGMWGQSGSNLKTDCAWMQPKTGLLYAVIDAKDIVTKEIERVLEVRGDIFRNFEWITTIKFRNNLMGVYTPNENIGLALITNTHRHEVYNNRFIKSFLLEKENTNYIGLR